MAAGEERGPLVEPAIDLPGLVAQLGGDPEDVVMLLGSFLRDAPQTVGRLERALAARDAREAEDAAHRLKGSVAWISARRAAALTAGFVGLARSGDLDSMSAGLPELVHELDRVFAEARQVTAGRFGP